MEDRDQLCIIVCFARMHFNVAALKHLFSFDNFNQKCGVIAKN